MVIIILGVLSAFALPKFADLGGEAKKASRDTLIGAINSTMAIAKAVCLAQPTCTPSGVFQNITINSQTVRMLGIWPQARTDGLLSALDVENYDITFGSNRITFTIDTDCTVLYTHGLHRRAPNISGDTTCS